MMLFTLCLLILCLSAGAQEYRDITYDDIGHIIDRLQTLSPGEDRPWAPEESNLSEEIPLDSSSEYQTSESTTHGYSSEDLEDGWYITDPTHVIEDKPEEFQEIQESSEQPDGEYAEHVMQAGAIRGIPGVTFPDYTDIPVTSFDCSDKVHVPGFYADLETGCQVFHVCRPHKRESFLCPVGTIFNQAILACDYWYSSNCSLAPHYYDVNIEPIDTKVHFKKDANVGSMIDDLLGKDQQHKLVFSEDSSIATSESEDLSFLAKFLPVKAKVVVYPEAEGKRSKLVAEASVGKVGKNKKHKVHAVKPHTPMTQTEDLEEEYMPTPIPVKPHTTKQQIYEDYEATEYVPVQTITPLPVQPHISEDFEPEFIPVHAKPKPVFVKVASKIHKPATEKFQPEYVQSPLKPKTVVKPFSKVPIASKTQTKPVHKEIDPSVSRIIDQVFEIAKRIVKESQHLLPMFDEVERKVLHKSFKGHKVYKPEVDSVHEVKEPAPKKLHLTKLNPLFITKPAEMAKQKPVEVPKAKTYVYRKPQTKSAFKIHKPVVLMPVKKSKMFVSPITKKTLSKNYLKFLKVKSG